MPLVDQIFRRHAGGIGVVDQNTVEGHVLVPVIDHDKGYGKTLDQIGIVVQHFRSQQDDGGGFVILDPAELFLKILLSAVQIAENHFKSVISAFGLRAGHHDLEKRSVFDDHAVFLIDYKLHFADAAFGKISKLSGCRKNRFRRLRVYAWFMIQRIGNGCRGKARFLADCFHAYLHRMISS